MGDSGPAPAISSLNGTVLPALRVSALASGESGELAAPALVIFVQPRCVASRRLLGLASDWPDAAESEVPVVLTVAGEPAEAARLAAEAPVRFDLSYVHPADLPAGLIDSIPCAVMLTPERRVRHAGPVGDSATMIRFIEACGDRRVRRWFSAQPVTAGP